MNRWLALVSRIGTTLTAIGLALLLISLIPSSSSGSSSQNVTQIQANTFSEEFGQTMSPQESVTLTVTSDRSIDVYLVEVSGSFLYQWITSNAGGKYFYNNVTYLKWFLGNFTQYVVYSQKATLSFNYQYTPTKITNATLIVSNPSSSAANIQSNWKVSQQVAPASKVATLADWSIPLGLVLAIPWFIDLYQRRVRRPITGPNVSA